MNKKLLLLLLIPLMGFIIPGNTGIKSSASNISYFKNDLAIGFKLLLSKTAGKLDMVLNKTNSTPAFIAGKLTGAGYSTSADKSPDAMRFLAENQDLFALKDPVNELRTISNFTDQIGMTHIKYQQLIKGYRILPSELIVHFNRDGSIESVNGNYLPTPVINTSPSLSLPSAVSIAENKVGIFNSVSKTTELVLYRKDNSLTLAYEVK